MNIQELTKIKQDYEKVLREKGREIMKSAVEAFFDANPKITGVLWTQYTPYFNDGEPCNFGVHEPAFSVSEINRADLPRHVDDGAESGFFNSYSARIYTDAEVKQYGDWAAQHNEKIREALESAKDEDVFESAGESFAATVGVAPEDLFLAAFGDHVQVLLTPDAISVEDFEHD